jgi:hypothetical protein|tara:strand:+ start:86 stop:1003 length:918 start_codon:yes stop_codon:yes gene_type:complete
MPLQMIPILMAGLGAARMVAKPLADQLIKKGIGKQVNKGVGRPISKVDDLPPAAQEMIKSPKAVLNQKASLARQAGKAKNQSAGAKKAATTRAANAKTPAAREAAKIKKARAVGMKKTKQQKDELVPSKADPDKLEKMMRIMNAKDKSAMQAVTGKRKAGGKVYRKQGKKVGPVRKNRYHTNLDDVPIKGQRADKSQLRQLLEDVTGATAMGKIVKSAGRKKTDPKAVKIKKLGTKRPKSMRKGAAKATSTKMDKERTDRIDFMKETKEDAVAAKQRQQKLSKFKKGGQITYRMTGGQVVGHGYD